MTPLQLRSTVPAVALVALALLATACDDTGSGGDTAPTPAPTDQPTPTDGAEPTPTEDAEPTPTEDVDPEADLCALVSEAEAQTVLGEDPAPGEISQGSCRYIDADEANFLDVWFGEKAEDLHESDEALGAELQPLDGVGDEAWLKDGGASGSVTFVVDDDWYRLDLTPEDWVAAQPLLVELATAVADRHGT